MSQSRGRTLRTAFWSLMLCVAAAPRIGMGADATTYWLGDTPIRFSHLVAGTAGTAVAANDPGVAELLKRLGATLTWQPGSTSVLITTAEPTIVDFEVGQNQYEIGRVMHRATFAPYLLDTTAYVSLNDLFAGLGLRAAADGARTVLRNIGAPTPQASAEVTPVQTPQTPQTPQAPAAVPSATAVPSANASLNPRLIVIDPGHGGSDPGIVNGTLYEKTFTLDIARRLRDLLVARGWTVVMTRDSDRDVFGPYASCADECGARDAIANSRGARLFVSIHVNGYINPGPNGATTFYYKSTDLPVADDINRRIASEGGIAADGVRKDDLYVLNHADMPATLVEVAFITNPADVRRLLSPQWRQTIAAAIADGITDYVGVTPPR